MNDYLYQMLISGEWGDSFVAPRETLAQAAYDARVAVGFPTKRVLLRHTNPSDGTVTVTVLWEGKRPPSYLGNSVAP